MAQNVIKSSGPGKASVWIAEHLMLASAVCFLLLTLICYAALFAPELRRIQQSNRAQALQQEKKLKQDYLASLQTLEKNYQAIPPDDVKRIAEIVPFEDDIPGLMASLEAVAKNDDVTVTNMGFSGGLGGESAGGGGGPAGLFKPLDVSMNIQNVNYARFKLFLQSLERHLRLFDVGGVSINPSAAQYVFSMRTYVQAKPLN